MMIAKKFQFTAFATILTAHFIALAAQPLTPAKAADGTRNVAIGADSIALPAPANACFLEPDQERDRALFTAIQRSIGPTNDLVAIFADCAERAAWRQGQALLQHHGQFQTMVKLKKKQLAMPREKFAKEVCAHEIAAASPANRTPILQRETSLLDEMTRQLGINQQQFLGVVSVDAEACFTGLIQKIRTGNDTARPEFAITATTLARGKVVYVYLYAPATGIDGFRTLLAKTKRLVSALLKANGG